MEGKLSVEPKSQGEIGGGSKRRRKIKKRVQRGSKCQNELNKGDKKKELASGVQRGTDSSQHPLIECKRVKEPASRVKSGIDASQGHIGRCSGNHTLSAKKKEHSLYQRNSRINKLIEANQAKLALTFYEKSQDAEFEILEVFYSRCSTLLNPESKLRRLCRHVSFMAKPKNGDVSPKHFFGEFVTDDFGVEICTCFTFEPNDYPGFDHGCILCPPVQKFHPAQGYGIGHFPWLNPEPIFRTCPRWKWQRNYKYCPQKRPKIQ